MKATVHLMNATIRPEVRLEHNGESIPFLVSVFSRDAFQKEHDVFEHINLYWQQLAEIRQQQIFNIYRDIQYGFENIHSKSELTDHLCNKVSELIIANNLDEIEDWIKYKSDIRIPDSIKEEYKHSPEKNTSREKTYTRADYGRLVALSMILRTMVPVWGEYIASIRQDTGTQFKEYFAFQLLNKSNLMQSVPMEKLKEYVIFQVDQDKNNSQNILSGISSDDYCYWLLALICVRKLCVGDIRGIYPEAHLMTLIWNFIAQKKNNNDSDFANIVKDKTVDEGSADSENKTSALERYKIKANISIGEIVELEFSLRDIRRVAYNLEPMIDPQVLERSLQTSQKLLTEKILDPQVTLLRWIFKPVISPKGIMYLPKTMIVQAIGVLEAILWTRGFKYLAILSSSYPLVADRDMIVSPVDSKMRVPKEDTERLDQLYPFTRISNSKKNGNPIINLAAKDIDLLSDNFTMFSWRPTVVDEMLMEVFGSNARRTPIRPDIKLDLTKLVIRIGERTYHY